MPSLLSSRRRRSRKCCRFVRNPRRKTDAVVLVLDKSGSMSGPKIEMARDAARSALKTLRPIDKIGVISFDESFGWVVPMGPATDLEQKGDLINKIAASGGTKIYQALDSGFQAIVKEEASRKHIILLTDGVSTPGTQEDFPKLEKDALAKKVTITTIGVGDYINRDLLDEIARKTKGKAHFVENPESIPQIINAEVRSLEDLAIQERPVRAERVRPVEFLDGIDFTGADACVVSYRQRQRKARKSFCGSTRKCRFSALALRLGTRDCIYVRCQEPLGSAVGELGCVRHAMAANGAGRSHRDRTVRAGIRPGHPRR